MFIRLVCDWIGALLVGIFALAIGLWCQVAHAETPTGNLETVYQTIAMESASEPQGMAYVALTIVNRARDRQTSLDIEALRRKQYSCWNSREWSGAWISRFYSETTRQRAINALSEAVAMSVKPQYRDIKHYHTDKVMPKWARGVKPTLRIGSHLYYRGIK